jgi:DNA polymerase III gamma/tau subunit/predicted DNA-binding transcriptional regulator AlpA
MTPLVEKYKPATLADFAGMERARLALANFAAAPYSSAWLLVGPAGTGKTTMAFAAARQIGGEIYHLPAKACDLEAVNRVCGKCFYRPWQGNWNHVIIDEGDQMSPAAQLAFLSKLDSTAAPPDTIFWFTANETRLLQPRFLSRCRKLTFDTAGLIEPGAALLAKIWQAEAAGAPAPDFHAVMQAAGCNIREALMLLETEMLAPGGLPQTAKPGGRPSHRALTKDCAIPDEESAALNAAAVGRILGIHQATVYVRVKQGRLPLPTRTGREMTWTRSQLTA